MKNGFPSSDRERLLLAALEACRRAGEIHRAHFRFVHLQVELKKDASPVTAADRASEEAIREILHRATPELGLLGEELGQEGSEIDRWIIDPIDGTKNFVAGLPFFATLIGLERGGELAMGVVHAPALGPGSGLFTAQPAGDPALAGETWWAVQGQGAWGGTGTTLSTASQRRLRVSDVAAVEKAFVGHGGLKIFQRRGLWPALTDLVARTGRTRGFGDWWGHILVAEGRCDAMVEGEVLLHDVAALKPIIEEAGGVFLTRHDAPLVSDFREATLSSNGALAEPLRELLGF